MQIMCHSSAIVPSKHSEEVAVLRSIRDSHKIWNNPLLIACAEKKLQLPDFQAFFEQYYFFSKNFTKLLSTALINCNSDYYRAKLSANLWEEGGGLDVELRHSEIFRKFLKNGLHIHIDDIKFEPWTESFFNQYLDLCLRAKPDECAAILSFGTEGIVARLYTIIKSGLEAIGISETELTFFNIHISCDDEHALTLEELSCSYQDEENWLARCQNAVTKALDLRDTFFNEIYTLIQRRKIDHLIDRVSHKPTTDLPTFDIKKLTHCLNDIHNILYTNCSLEAGIHFTVDRVAFESDVLDPRVVRIPVGFKNEYHSHAHETLFFILSGSGEVIIDKQCINAQVGDLVFVPRWVHHQTKNNGNEELVFLAITDYGLTRRLANNSETIYRMNINDLSLVHHHNAI